MSNTISSLFHQSSNSENINEKDSHNITDITINVINFLRPCMEYVIQFLNVLDNTERIEANDSSKVYKFSLNRNL